MKLSLMRLYSYLVLVSAFAFSSCQKENLYDEVKELFSPTKDKTYKGPQVQVGNGHARTFLTINHKGVPKEIGVILSHDALSGLPAINKPYVLELPRKAFEMTPFKHVAMG